MTQRDIWMFWMWASNQEAVELYAHGPLWDKPQHRTNWHSVTWTGLRPTDQSQNCKQAQHWTMGERTASRGRGVSDNQKKQVNKQTTKSKDHPKELKNDSDAEPQQWGETEEAAELWRLQETSARHQNNNRGGRESNSDYKTTWSPEQHPARRQQWEKWGVKGEKQKRNQRYTNRTDDSSQPDNTARVQLPHTPPASLQPKHSTALFAFSRACQHKITVTIRGKQTCCCVWSENGTYRVKKSNSYHTHWTAQFIRDQIPRKNNYQHEVTCLKVLFDFTWYQSSYYSIATISRASILLCVYMQMQQWKV